MAPVRLAAALPADARARAPRARASRTTARPARRCCTTGCCRLARHLGSSPPLNLWVRTAPRGAERLLLADRRAAAAHAPRGPRALDRPEPQHRRARARRRAAARRLSARRRGGRLGCPAAMPPEERFVPRFAAEPPQEELPYGRWEERLREEFLAAALALDGRAAEDLGEPGAIVWYPDRSWHGRTYVPATRAHHRRATSCSATCASCPAARTSEPERLLGARRLHRGDRRAQPRLAAGPLRGGDRQLARAVRRGGRDDARVGAPAGLGRARSSPPSSPTWRSTSASSSRSASR